MDKKGFTTYQISKICDVYISTVIDWIEAGKLKAHRTPGGHRRVSREDLVVFLKKYNIPVPRELEEYPDKKILIVDDDLEAVKLMKMLQSSSNYHVRCAENRIQAEKVFSEFNPDLVISEINLPGLDGIELLKSLKAKHPNVEVILLANSPSIKTVVEAMRLGSYDYLVKPFEKENFISIVKGCFERPSLIEEPTKLKGLNALYEVSKAMSSMMDLNNLLDMITKLVYEALDPDGVSIMLLVDSKYGAQELEIKSVVGSFKNDIVGKRIKIGERIAGLAAKLNEPILINGSIEEDKRFEDIQKFEDTKSGMSVPLVVKNKLIGVINVRIVEGDDVYNEDDLKLLTVFASDAAIAIENVKIVIQLTKHTEELERLLKESRDLHL